MNDVSEQKLTVGKTAKLAGVSVRTLHHYDEIGLVVPSGRTTAGYRIYTATDVERLYQVLTYRELGFALEDVQKILDDPEIDVLEHLKSQLEHISAQIDRLHQMAAAVATMMEAKKMGVQLTPDEQREIFGDKWVDEDYSGEAERRWGHTDAWKQSQERAAQFTKEDLVRIKAEGEAYLTELADALAGGVKPGSAAANTLAEKHRAGISQFYDCDHTRQVCLAEMYLQDPRFRAYYDDRADGLAQFVHDIIVANAAAQ